MNQRLSFFLSLLCYCLSVAAQQVTGVVTNATNGETVPFANVFYEGDKRAVQTDVDGKFSIAYKKGRLYISNIGFDSKNFRIDKPQHLDVRLIPNARLFNEATVTGKKKKYSRKNNPAVELMRKVIAAKKKSNLKEKDYYCIDKYSKITFAFNDVTDKVFEEGKFKKFPFLKDHVEINNATGKLILPISVDETVSSEIYRKKPETTKTIVTGQRSNGINDLINTGDILNTMLKDCFTDVDIYEDEIRLLQSQFISPISSRSAISFYRYFIEDTLMVNKDKCFELTFTPNNPQDFGFTGTLYIMADSTWRVKKIDIGLPKNTNVNFIESLRIIQEFQQLPSGEQVTVSDDMLVQLKLVDFLQKFQVQRTTQYKNFSFDPIPDQSFKFKGDILVDANAQMRDEEFWEEQRTENLTRSESRMDAFINNLQNIKGFKPVLFVAKAFIENFVETSTDPKKPSKVDIGPVNTIITKNFVEGWRLRASAQTTANLHPNIFLKGYVAHGFKDHRWKGMGEMTYSFNKKASLPREFPVNNLTFTYANDVMSPSDKFLPTDKDNVFVSFKWTSVEHMMYYQYYNLLWDREWANGFRLNLQLRSERDRPTGTLFYQPLDGNGAPSADPAKHLNSLQTTDFKLGFIYQPGATWTNTKQRRIAANHDAPRFSLSHTVGVKGVLGGDYHYNFTEASIDKRFWLASWGKIDATLKGGVQWNQVPFPLLIMPPANLSYIREDNMFSLINNMEFLNDRYASLMLAWDMNGKIFNRIPLLKKLKWREHIGCNILWGTLSSKNNPFLEKNASNANLYYFPGHFHEDGSYKYLSTVMDKKKPYVEVVAGIHNIFKLLHIEYVRRLTYLDDPQTKKWGVRLMLRVKF